MNVQELRAALAATDLDPRLYCILEQPDDSQWCLRKQGKTWQTFWYERGAEYEMRRFKDEKTACVHFFGRITQRAP
ncbi:unnamed protein product [[Actinomadura] parvosata subsp. kistnae]|uniref:Uncharacterized protein n=1 Tax=[Actinomadura] parvosata subsp. kistnae TaxID=1909395 RepID=A0A1V0AEC1_9ACTN|nr:hypothetical protein [Nonomuraea sp. ATCC 55076]AQZ68533.1 hypothetical protein BKM31_49995 [Nonomuraea sp. ATCC 55076]SPL93004.1 unnamed protein product [Actinomadura parvosata subsp. kistnae]